MAVKCYPYHNKKYLTNFYFFNIFDSFYLFSALTPQFPFSDMMHLWDRANGDELAGSHVAVDWRRFVTVQLFVSNFHLWGLKLESMEIVEGNRKKQMRLGGLDYLKGKTSP